MELFDHKGCLTDAGLQALAENRLDELARLEAAEHLAYCDRCIDRYTALLSDDLLQTPPQPVLNPVMKSLWVRIMRNTLGRAAVASVAALLALALWGSGGLQRIAAASTQIPVQNTAPKPDAVTRMWDACDELVDHLFDFDPVRPSADKPFAPGQKLSAAIRQLLEEDTL